VQKHHGMTEEELIKIGSLVKHTLSSRHPDNAPVQDHGPSQKAGQTIAEVARRRRSSAVARPAKIVPGRRAG